MKCPRCGSTLFEGAPAVDIGSPIVRCPKCQCDYRNKYRVEWDAYPSKAMVYMKIPLLALIGMISASCVGGNGALVLICTLIFSIIGVFMSLSDVTKIVESKKRMKDPNHLKALLHYGVISMDEYGDYMSKLISKSKE